MKRLDILACEKLEISREKTKKLILNSKVLVNGVVQSLPKLMVEEESEITLDGELPTQNQQMQANYEIPLEIVFEDEDILVINKQKGLMVHEGASENYNTLANALLAKYGENFKSVGSAFRPGIVHRLDKETTGLMVIAKNEKSFQRLTEMIANREITRKYLAVCFGKFRLFSGTVNISIGTDPQNRIKQKVMQIGGKQAITHYRVLDSNSHFSLVECTLETGRTHQIRVHLAHIGHPIVGDTTYTKKTFEGFTSQALHAYKLEFLHPISGKNLFFTSYEPFRTNILQFNFIF